MDCGVTDAMAASAHALRCGNSCVKRLLLTRSQGRVASHRLALSVSGRHEEWIPPRRGMYGRALRRNVSLSPGR